MKMDHQHLDFLISQYVDDSLDAPNRKLIEHQLTNDRNAKRLYQEHRDVQDILDDLGNRIPMINWADFDQKLASRLESEATRLKAVPTWRKWTRPLAAAAALIIAASIGYSWHAWSVGNGAPLSTGTEVTTIVIPERKVLVEQPVKAGYRQTVEVAEHTALTAAGRPADVLQAGAGNKALVKPAPSAVTAGTATQPSDGMPQF